MTVKDLKAANDSETPDSQDAVAESQEAPSLEELASRQQAAMAKLKETTSAFDTLLEETISAVDESISQSKKMTDEVRDQASEKAAAVMAEAQARAQTIVSEADREASAQDRAAMGKVSVLIEAARSSAGRVARPSREQLPMLTGEIWAALEASIEQSLRTVLKDLQNLEEETKLSEGQEGPQVKFKEADQGFPRAGDSEIIPNRSTPMGSRRRWTVLRPLAKPVHLRRNPMWMTLREMGIKTLETTQSEMVAMTFGS